MNIINGLALALTLLVSVQAAVSNEVDSLTFDDQCDLENGSLQRGSSVQGLLAILETNPKCHDLWLAPLRRMQQILDASAIDACSLETINLIEEYHWHFVVGTLSKSWREASEEPIPEPLKMFFLHFVQATAEKCKADVGRRLQEAISGDTADSRLATAASFGALLDGLSVTLVPQSKIKGYGDFFFIYNALINSEKKKGYLIEETIPDPSTGEVTYLSVKMHDASKTLSLQDRCRQQLYPIYSNTVLPLMKLVDLGFGHKSHRFASDAELLAEWYGNAQLCEFILPVKFYSSSTLKEGQVALIKDEEEAELLEGQNSHQIEQTSTKTVAISPSRLQDEILADNDDQVVDEIKTNFRSRSRIYRKALRNFLKTVKTTLMSKIKSIFGHKKSATRLDDAELKASLAEVEKSVDAEEELEEKDTNEVTGDLVRHKRSGITDLANAEKKKKRKKLKKKLLIFSGVVLICIALILGSLALGGTFGG